MNDEQGLKEIIRKLSLYLDNYNSSTYSIDEFIENVCGLSDHYDFEEDSEYDEELALQEIINRACDIVELDEQSEVDQFGVPIDQKKQELIDEINEYLNTDFEILTEIESEDEDTYDDEDLEIDPYDDTNQ